MRTPFTILEICSNLKRISSQLPFSALGPVSAALRATSPELLRLCFIPLRHGESVEIHRNSVFAPAVDYMAAEGAPGVSVWVVFEAASHFESSSKAAAPGVPIPAASTLAELLEGFDFFAPIACTSEIRQIDRCLSEQITAIQRLRPVLGAELHGDQLSLRSPVLISLSSPDTLHLTGLSPLDPPPGDHVQSPMAVAGQACAPVVVLGERPITIESDPTVRLTRVR